MTNPSSSSAKKSPAQRVKQWAPIALLATAFIVFFATGLHEMLTLDELARRYGDLNAFIEHNFWISVFGAIATYIVVTAASLPAASLLSVAIGLMFGWAIGATIIVIGATLGASILFFAARSLLVDFFRQRAGDKLNVMAAGFRNDAVSYMLFLRLAAIFPFFVVNFVPAILGVRFSVFFWTTAIGIIPGTIAYAFAGEGLRSIVAERAIACTQNIAPCGQPFSIGDIVTREMLIAFILLALVSLLPVVLKRLRKSPAG
ncbi:MAG: VTT domain-containing protein [Devosiaceae bacterium]|nr:VTT domain-containing protein [Devosiaceae bacterium]